MNKQNMVYPQSEILFTYKKELSTDTCYNMMNLEYIMLRKISQLQRTKYCVIHLYEMSIICKSIETESRLEVARS